MQRWWAPQRATVEPDQVVLAMLEPGDLGSCVLAVHRAGAAAIDTLRNGMVSETGLASVLADSRSRVADQVVSSVAKSLNATYAGLLVSDVFDDAEQGAVSLYRTAVSRGVAPSVAVARVSDVFGVPTTSMGAYQSAATDPKTNAAAARDQADRTLLTYVAKLVATEEGSVAKAVMAGDWDESEVNRDEQGRFAPESRPRVGTLEYTREQLGLTGAPAEVGDTGTKRAAPRKIQRLKRLKRVSLTPTSTEPEAPASQNVNQAGVRQAGGGQAGVRQAQAQKLNKAASKKLTAAARARKPQLTGDMLAVIDDDDQSNYRDLYNVSSLVIRAPLRGGQAFRDILGDQAARFRDKSAQVFRVGHLEHTVAITDAEQPGLANDWDARQGAANTVKAPAIAYTNATGLPWLDSETLRDSEVATWSGMTAADVLKVRAQRQNSLTAGTRWTPNEKELEYAFVLPVYTPYDTEDETDEWALVHFNAEDKETPGLRVIPTVEEYVLLGTPKGYIEEGGTKKTWDQIHLDPNAVYEFVPAPSAKAGSLPAEHRLWDKENEVIVNRWFLRQLSEDEVDQRLGTIGKADTHTFQESDVIRDSHGRFAPEPDAAPTRAQPRKIQRLKRLRRVSLAPRDVPETVASATVTQAGVNQAGSSTTSVNEAFHQSLHQAIRQAEVDAGADPEELDEPDLQTHKGYKVLSKAQWNKAVQLSNQSLTELEREGKEVILNASARQMLLGHESMHATNVPFKMAMVLNSDPKLDQEPSETVSYLHMSEATIDNVAAKVAEIFKNHAKASKVEIIRHGEVLTFNIPTVKSSPQVLLEIESDVNWKNPVTLTYVGKFRARDLTVNTEAGIERLISSTGNATEEKGFEGAVFNPDLVYYRIAHKRYRASN